MDSYLYGDAPATVHNRGMKDRPDPRGDNDRRRRELHRRLRLAFLAGAEHHSRQTMGRPLTEDELEFVIGRFPPESAPKR